MIGSRIIFKASALLCLGKINVILMSQYIIIIFINNFIKIQMVQLALASITELYYLLYWLVEFDNVNKSLKNNVLRSNTYIHSLQNKTKKWVKIIKKMNPNVYFLVKHPLISLIWPACWLKNAIFMS